MYKSHEALRQYRNLGLSAEVSHASPHRLIQLLFEGLLAQLHQTIGAIERIDYQARAKSIDKSVAILSALRSSLDLSQGELADNLDRLYEYMSFRLLEASQHNDAARVQEVINLIKTIKSAWDALPTLNQ